MDSTAVIRKIGNYIMGEMIGKGCYGHVRIAIKMGDSKPKYAIKYMKYQSQHSRKSLLTSVERENSIKEFNHPNLLRVYETDSDGIYSKIKGREVEQIPVAYVVLQLARNGNLFDFVVSLGGLREDIARYFLLQMIDAIDYLHCEGMAHRDIKP